MSNFNVLRAVTIDGAFRVMAVETTDTVRGAIEAQGATGAVAVAFADMLTASVLVRESMSPDLRVQCVLQGDDQRSRLVADTHPDGMTRGLVQLAPGATEFTFAEKGMLQVHRTMHNGALHQGVIAVPPGGSMATAFMTYMQESEQVVSMMAVGCAVEDGQVRSAGGYLVQLLPDAAANQLAVMAERLEDFRDIVPLLAKGVATPRFLIDETLYGMPFEQVAERTVHFGCNCSSERLTAGLASLPRKEIETFVLAGELLEIRCDFCGREFKINPDTLRGLLETN
jgi:molecular chaperone Hsp33